MASVGTETGAVAPEQTAPAPAGRALAPRPALPPFPARELVVPGLVLAALTAAELLTAIVNPPLGIAAHAAILTGLVMLGARTSASASRELYWTLTLAPVIRIASLSLPLGTLPLIDWFPLIGLPIFLAAVVTARKLGYTREQIGLAARVNDLPRQVAIVPLGAVLGIGEYLIFRPVPMAPRFDLADLWYPALVLLIFTGLEEELIFRGLMQRAALRALGRWGLVYISSVFAILHIGYLSVLDVVFVFIVGMLFSLFVLRTRSLLGVTIAHGAVNIGLFLILPFVAPVYLGSGYADLLPLPAPPVVAIPH